MTKIADLIRSLKEIPTKYPAVISAYIIYSYLFMVMLRFFIVAKNSSLHFYDIVEIFDALPFMWLLAVTLVKVIDIRTKLYESETQRILNEKELQIKETQIDTMREVVSGLEHQINNPLSIITGTLYKVNKLKLISPEMNKHFSTIEVQSKRILAAMKAFSETQNYTVKRIGDISGSMAVPESHS